MRTIIYFLLLTQLIISGCSNTRVNEFYEVEKAESYDLLNLTNTQDSVGINFFINHCTACHDINRYSVARSFQKIRDFYDEKWLAGFIQNNDSLKKLNDIRIPNIFRQSGTQCLFTEICQRKILLAF